ncbi:hypothetical protein RIR_jg26487.t1 [Rhizophagus irregularis DAOM 181602=DAOM 197198]|nr:hypothetical protein RIR_jg26487.t1 [Rhizophagus irregularis DAOM 181602=DAOM 197198]
MDAAMEQTIGFQGRTLRWGTSNDSKALCHRCGKLGCAPTSCPLNQHRGRSRTRDPVAALKDRFNIGQRPAQQRTPRNNSRSRSRSKSRDRSASAQRINPPSAPVVNSEPDRMEEDPPENTGTLIPHPNAPSSSGPKKSTPPKTTPTIVPHSALTSTSTPSPQDELNSVIQDQKAIKDTLQSLTGSIQGFIASLGGSPSDRASAPSQ